MDQKHFIHTGKLKLVKLQTTKDKICSKTFIYYKDKNTKIGTNYTI